MRTENKGHRSSCKLKLGIHKWVKDWKQSTNYVCWALTVYQECSRYLECIDFESCSNPMGWLPSLPDKGVKGLEYQANELGFVLQAGDLKLLCDALEFPGGASEVLWGTRKGIQGAKASLLTSKLEIIYSHLLLFSRLLSKALLEENITLTIFLSLYIWRCGTL